MSLAGALVSTPNTSSSSGAGCTHMADLRATDGFRWARSAAGPACKRCSWLGQAVRTAVGRRPQMRLQPGLQSAERGQGSRGGGQARGSVLLRQRQAQLTQTGRGLHKQTA